jgi:hypothetical protein
MAPFLAVGENEGLSGPVMSRGQLCTDEDRFAGQCRLENDG